MARQTRRSSGGFARASRRLTAWTSGPGGDDIAFDTFSTGATGSQIIGSGITPTVNALTVVRIRGMFQIRLSTADAGGSGFTYAVGIGMVTSDAFGIGVTAIPKPFDDQGWPGWLWHHFGVIKAPQEVLDLNQVQASTVEIDSKAMRKFRVNETLMAVIQFGEVATATVAGELVTRVLVKLP